MLSLRKNGGLCYSEVTALGGRAGGTAGGAAQPHPTPRPNFKWHSVVGGKGGSYLSILKLSCNVAQIEYTQTGGYVTATYVTFFQFKFMY
jgi:hypothetical protein